MAEYIPGGYVLKPRSIENSWIAHASPVVREVWDWLTRNANHKSGKYDGYEIARGQKFTSITEIREALSWHVGYRKMSYSVNQMKHTMKVLRSNSMITTTNHPRGMVVSICNYDKYQTPSNYESTNESTDESSINQPSINRQSPSINKNVKNDNNEKNGKKEYSDLFIEFWSVYPKDRKSDKPGCYAKFKKQPHQTQLDIIEHVRIRATCDRQWLEGYIPLSKTFMNNNRWTDEYESTKKARTENYYQETQTTRHKEISQGR